MAHQGNNCQPVEIVRPEDESRFSLDIDALKRILLADDVKNLPVAVVSIAGGFRMGKSFLMNFFLQYMRNSTRDDWMADPSAKLEGFPWRGGSERATTGILMWPEVFVVTTTGGKKIAVLFLDTQGTFDCSSTVKECVTIFALSMMASSVQIYNLSKNIGEDDLQHLQLFTQYGRLALQETRETPFQNLLFLVRDWQWKDEKPYGFAGGNSLLQACLSATKKQKMELKRLREDIRPCFTEMSCFLMPHPGKMVASEPSFVGWLSDIDDDFTKQLRELVPSVLQPNKLVVKKINGSEISCQELLVQLQLYAKTFNTEKLPDPKSMFEAAVEANNLMAVNRAINHYRNGMEEVFHGEKSYLDCDSLQKEHQRVRKSALDLFESVPKLGGEVRSEKCKDELEKWMDLEYKGVSIRNESERIREEEKNIKDGAHKEAKRIRARAKAEWKKMITHQQEMMAFLSSPAGIFLNVINALFGAGPVYAPHGANYAVMEPDTSSDEDRDEGLRYHAYHHKFWHRSYQNPPQQQQQQAAASI